jgi:hypothetical protein
MTTVSKILTAFGFILILIGAFFKMLHWPNSIQMIGIGTIISIIVVWLILFTSTKK